MGMFSWNCKACGFSMRDCHNCSEDNWMGQVVIMTKGGSRAVGSYDGYGRAGGFDFAEMGGGEEPCCYHQACWELVGKPEFDGPSRYARDQGFCLPVHGMPLPKPTKEWLAMCPMWHALDRVIEAYGRLLAELEMKEAEDTYGALSAEARERLCVAFRAAQAAFYQAQEECKEAWYSNPDLGAPEPPEVVKPETFEFEGVTFDHGWLGVLVARAERATRPQR
jgi:hypothetical protein